MVSLSLQVRPALLELGRLCDHSWEDQRDRRENLPLPELKRKARKTEDKGKTVRGLC